MTNKNIKINRFKLAEQSNIALADLQHWILMKTNKLIQSQEHIKQLVTGCVNTNMLMAEGTLEFNHDNLDVIKNKIAEQRRQNDK